MTLEFNPNNPAKQKNRPIWATYIPNRKNADFKQHTTRGHALNAMGYHYNGCILYTWKIGEWVEVYRIEPDSQPDHCERCGREERPYHRNKTFENTVYLDSVWIGKPVLRYIRVCRDCKFNIVWKKAKDGSSLLRGDVIKVDDRQL